MRFGIFVLVACLVPFAFGQSETGPTETPFATPPQVFVTVSKDQMGADLVRVTVRDANYNPALLQFQCNTIGKFANGNARGIEIKSRSLGSESGGSVVQATFACDNLIDVKNDRLNIDAIVKGFLGSTSPMVSSFLIQFEGELISNNSIQRYVDDTVMLEGRALTDPDGIEYRVEVLTQDTRAIQIPGSLAEMPESQAKPQSKSSLNPIVIPILAIGVLAAGALVYFALLKPGHNKRKK